MHIARTNTPTCAALFTDFDLTPKPDSTNFTHYTKVACKKSVDAALGIR